MLPVKNDGLKVDPVSDLDDPERMRQYATI